MVASFHLSGPYIKSPETTEKIMHRVLLALLPAVLAGLLFFGPYALFLLLATACSAVLWEIPFLGHPFNWKKPLGDGSAFLAGLLLGLTFSPLSPWWLPLGGSFFAVVVGKQLLGGLGNNPFNPALVARALLLLSWPLHLSQWATPFDGLTTATPLMGYTASPWQLFLGTVPGSMGETSGLALLIGGFYLFKKNVIPLEITASYLITASVMAYCLGFHPLSELLSGSLLFAAIFFVNDPVSSPVTKKGRLLFGIGCGVFTMIIRAYTAFPEGVTFAVLFMNGSAYLLDTLTDGVPFRKKKEKQKEDIFFTPLAMATGIVLLLILGGHYMGGLPGSLSPHQREEEKILSFFPGAKRVEETVRNDESLPTIYDDTAVAGYALEVEIGGYRGPIRLLTAFDREGNLIGSTILQHSEDYSLGARITGEEFLSQFTGIPYLERNRVHQDLEIISGATISSRGVARGIQMAYQQLALLLGWEEKFEVVPADLPPGIYQGKGFGLYDEIGVQLVLEEGRIQEIEVLYHIDSPSIAEYAFSVLKEAVLEKQSPHVHVITGATYSSEGFLDAVKDALQGERRSLEEAHSPYPSGSYRGRGEGARGIIRVRVLVENGTITKLEVLSHADAPSVAEPAFSSLMENILEKQSLDMDVISGATYSSTGFLTAVKDALDLEQK